jgi:putative aldouronate transport system permease protein
MAMPRNCKAGIRRGPGNRPRSRLAREIAKNRYIYLMLAAPLACYIIFNYVPMYGLVLAFKEYKPSAGVLGSPWVGFKHFRRLFDSREFFNALKNTLAISFGRILFQFPAPILLAFLYNELRGGAYKKMLQTVYTLPNFLSWVIISSIMLNFLASDGAINNLIVAFGGQRVDFLASKTLFRPILYLTDIWKSAGWGSIIYLAAITSISPQLYEAAVLDGAGRGQQMLHITWPCIRPTVVVMLILSIGGIMNAGFEQIFNMQNPVVRDVSDIIDTYVYRIAFQTSGDFAFSTAVGFFKGAINFMLLIAFDRLAKGLGESGLF